MHLQNRGSNLFHQMIRYILVMTQLKRIQCSYVYNKNWVFIDEEKIIFTGLYLTYWRPDVGKLHLITLSLWAHELENIILILLASAVLLMRTIHVAC